jgi:RHS repeat-associated protein
LKVEYDLMGRVYRRTVPAIYYTSLDSDYVYGVPGGIGSHLGDLLALGDVIEFQYDADGHMTSADNRYATVTRTYNKEGSLATEQQLHKWNSASLQLQYTYNRAGLRQTMSGSGRSFTYSYNTANQLSAIAMSTGGSIGFAHDEAGRLMTVTYPTGQTVQHYYKMEGQPLRVSAPVHTLTYQLYDNAGRLRELYITGDSTRTDYFEYDGRGQLTHLYNSFSNQAYRYDASGNRTHAFECGDGCGNYTAYTLEPLTNRIANWKRYVSSTLQHEGNYYFNINGEQTRATTSDGGATDPYYRKFSHYNAAGQMVGDFNTSGRSWDRFGSDGLGRRVKGSWADPNASTFYDGDGVIKFTANLETADYVQGPGIDAPLIEYLAGQTPCYYATTGNRLIAYFQASGFKCPSERWQSHGQVGGAVANSYGFSLSGNSDAGVSYFRNRLYDSNTGRFTSEDPIGFAGGINLYGYTGNNPASYTDPFGLSACKDREGREIPCDPGQELVNAVGARLKPAEKVITTIAVGEAMIAGGVVANGLRAAGPSALSPVTTKLLDMYAGSAVARSIANFGEGFAASTYSNAAGQRVPAASRGLTLPERAAYWSGRAVGWVVNNPEKVAAALETWRRVSSDGL